MKKENFRNNLQTYNRSRTPNKMNKTGASKRKTMRSRTPVRIKKKGRRGEGRSKNKRSRKIRKSSKDNVRFDFNNLDIGK